MKNNITLCWIGALSALAAVTMVSCGDNGKNDLAGSAPNPGTAPAPPSGLSDNFGAINFKCDNQQGGQQQQQQKQVPYQQQSSCVPSQQQQKVQYQTQSKVTDFDIDLDCKNRVVIVSNKGSHTKSQTLPIASNGDVNGKLQFLELLKDDGKNSGMCWAGYEVSISGKAFCDVDTNPIPNPPPGKKLQLQTQVQLKSTTSAELQQADKNGELKFPGPIFTILAPGHLDIHIPPGAMALGNNAFMPSPAIITFGMTVTWHNDDSVTHTVTSDTAGVFDSGNIPPGGTFSHTFVGPAGDVVAQFPYHCSLHPSMKGKVIAQPGTNPSPAPSTSPLPNPLPSTTVTPIKICVIDKVCPVEGKTELSCPQQQTTPGQ